MINFPRNIAIIGVGLIGGSIALGLKRHYGSRITILGSCNDLRRSYLAKKSKSIIDQVLNIDEIIANDVGLIVIATPVKAVQTVLKSIITQPLINSLVIDVGSTKHIICQFAQTYLPDNIHFIGTHPMAGKEMSGFENANPYLFRNKPWIICPTKQSTKQDLDLIKQLVTILGAKLIIMDSARHDEVVAWSSHLFLTMGSLLVGTVTKQDSWRTIAKIASTGFRDITRLASHSPEMKADIILSNKSNIINTLQETKEEIDKFIKLITDDDSDKLLTYLKKTKAIRDHWLLKYFS